MSSVNKISKIALSTCIDTKQFKENNDNDYFIGNLLSDVREYLESKKLKILFTSCVENTAMAPFDRDKKGFFMRLDAKNDGHKLVLALFGETSTQG